MPTFPNTTAVARFAPASQLQRKKCTWQVYGDEKLYQRKLLNMANNVWKINKIKYTQKTYITTRNNFPSHNVPAQRLTQAPQRPSPE